MARATFGAGCFWEVEAAFRTLRGVCSTRVGYAGGHTANPSYEEVCGGETGHAEVVEVSFDPSRIDYEALLAAFWACHDATRGHGPEGQYRSVIYTHDAEQARLARESFAAQAASHPRLATLIEPAPDFWPAEDDHQQFLEKRAAGVAV